MRIGVTAILPTFETPDVLSPKTDAMRRSPKLRTPRPKVTAPCRECGQLCSTDDPATARCDRCDGTQFAPKCGRLIGFDEYSGATHYCKSPAMPHPGCESCGGRGVYENGTYCKDCADGPCTAHAMSAFRAARGQQP